MIDHKLGIFFVNALILKEFFQLDDIYPHLGHLFKEKLFAFIEVRFVIPVAIKLASSINFAMALRPLRKSRLYLSFFYLVAWYGGNVALFEKVKQLVWNFLQSLLR